MPTIKGRQGVHGNRIPTIEVYLGRAELMIIVDALKGSGRQEKYQREISQRLATLALACPYPDELEPIEALVRAVGEVVPIGKGC